MKTFKVMSRFNMGERPKQPKTPVRQPEQPRPHRREAPERIKEDSPYAKPVPSRPFPPKKK